MHTTAQAHEGGVCEAPLRAKRRVCDVVPSVGKKGVVVSGWNTERGQSSRTVGRARECTRKQRLVGSSLRGLQGGGKSGGAVLALLLSADV